MGFNDIKQRVISCLLEGTYDHEVRRNIDVKNLFQCGQLSEQFLMELILATRGSQYDVSPHHKAPEIDVHVMKPVKNRLEWYIKFYFVDPDLMFISVHQSEQKKWRLV